MLIVAFSSFAQTLHFFDSRSKRPITDVHVRIHHSVYLATLIPDSLRGSRFQTEHIAYLPLAGILGQTDSLFLEKRIYSSDELIQTAFRSSNGLAIELNDHTKQLAVADILSQESSVMISDFGGGGAAKTLRIRGSGDKHTSILIDGVPTNDSQNGWSILNILPSTQTVQNVQLFKTGSTAKLGDNSILGSLQLGLIPQINTPLKIQQSTAVSIYDRHIKTVKEIYTGVDQHEANLSISLPFSNTQVQLNYGYDNAENAMTYQRGTKYYQRLGNDHSQQSGSLSFQHIPTTKTILSGTILFGELNAGTPGQAGDYNPKTPTEQLINDQNRQLDFFRLFRLGALYQFDAKWLLSANLALQNHTMNYRFTNKHFNERWFAKLNAQYAQRNQTIDFGFVRHYAELQSTDVGFAQRWKHSALVNYQLKLSSSEFELSSRYDHFNDERIPFPTRSKSFFSWQTAYTKQVSRTEKASIDLAGNYVYPSFNDLFWPNGSGDPSLKSEYSTAINASLQSVVLPFLNVRLNAFYYRYNNLIVWNPIGSLFRPENVQNAIQHGIELNIQQSNLALFKAKVSSQLSYLWNNKIDQQTERQLSYIPVHTVTHRLNLHIESWHVSFNSRFQSEELASNGEALSDYKFNLDFWLSYKLHLFENTQFMPFFEIKNSTNEFQESQRFYPLPNRLYRIGFTLTFIKDTE